MKLAWTRQGWEDYLHWQEADRKILVLVNALTKDTMRHPFQGLGKPEPLKHALKGWWSRRITGDHRLVYRVSGKDDAQTLEIAACRYHYG
jgi:toxin YoeB